MIDRSFHLRSIVKLIELAGDDPNREALKDTPERFLNAWDEWTSGYGKDPDEILKSFEDGSERYNELVFQGNISFWSLCEHHLAPFFGIVHIGYIPNGRIVGLSKLGRLVEVYARRLQVQERMTTQIADALNKYLEPKAVGVVCRARHSCMESRGIKKSGTVTYTSALRGTFREDAVGRSEFLRFVERADAEAANV